MLTIDDTKRADDKPIITDKDIEEERKAGMSEELILQEYYCSFEAAIEGSYYGKQLAQARKDGRITEVQYTSELPVHTVWDLGIDDSTAIGFYQKVGNETREIDYYENSGEGLDHYIDVLKDKPYNYGLHFAPHDIKVREFSTGRSRLETARSKGLNFNIIPNISISDGIDAGRKMFDHLYIDRVKCQRHIDCLASYTKKWDDKNKCFQNKPLHNWASHGGDVHRYAALVEIQFNNNLNKRFSKMAELSKRKSIFDER